MELFFSRDNQIDYPGVTRKLTKIKRVCPPLEVYFPDKYVRRAHTVCVC